MNLIHNSAEVTPDDNADITPSDGLYLGTGGDLIVIEVGASEAHLYANAAAGYHPISARRVLATGTTAQNILALYLK